VRRLGVLVAALALAGCSGGGTPGATPAASAQGQIVFSQPSYSCASVAGSGTSGPKLSWSANLTDKAGGLALTIVYARKQANGAERSVIQGDMPVSNPDFSQFQQRHWPVLVLRRPLRPGRLRNAHRPAERLEGARGGIIHDRAVSA